MAGEKNDFTFISSYQQLTGKQKTQLADARKEFMPVSTDMHKEFDDYSKKIMHKRQHILKIINHTIFVVALHEARD